GSEAFAKAYLDYLWTEQGQEIIAQHHYRPRNPEVLAKYADRFPAIKLFTIGEIIPGGWADAQRIHFADGRLFDQIYDR
ncbi:MAG: sulfate ABC transporter substrate-binding protein, partial [Methylomicrobium sp.]|nr:sulfate ABC transporter substrate-binding protein [Methylomicrobium sp.]